MAGLRRFQAKYGHLDVPRSYIDTHDDGSSSGSGSSSSGGGSRSPPLKLGIAVSNIRRGAAYSDLYFAAQLDRLGFVWEGKRGPKPIDRG